ncbi:hypothetical protein ACJJTC_008660, partial [Scirpophaga incertulas]
FQETPSETASTAKSSTQSQVAHEPSKLQTRNYWPHPVVTHAGGGATIRTSDNSLINRSDSITELEQVCWAGGEEAARLQGIYGQSETYTPGLCSGVKVNNHLINYKLWSCPGPHQSPNGVQQTVPLSL